MSNEADRLTLEILAQARILASLPDGYTLEVGTPEKRAKIKEDYMTQHRALRALKKAVRELDALPEEA